MLLPGKMVEIADEARKFKINTLAILGLDNVGLVL
jgi:hypothetical protein